VKFLQQFVRTKKLSSPVILINIYDLGTTVQRKICSCVFTLSFFCMLQLQGGTSSQHQISDLKCSDFSVHIFDIFFTKKEFF